MNKQTMIQDMGRVAEYAVMIKLAEMNVEAYLATSLCKPNFDITVIQRNPQKYIRVQVKGTQLHGHKASMVSNVDREYDYLVIVAKDANGYRYFIMTKVQFNKMRNGFTSPSFNITRQERRKIILKEDLLAYEDNWKPLIC